VTTFLQAVHQLAPHNVLNAIMSGGADWREIVDPPVPVLDTVSSRPLAPEPHPPVKETIRPLQRTKVRRNQNPVQRVKRVVRGPDGKPITNEFGEPLIEDAWVEGTDARPTFTSLYSRHAGPGTRRRANSFSGRELTRQEMGVTKGLGSTSWTRPGETPAEENTIYTAKEQAARVKHRGELDEVLQTKPAEAISRPTAGLGSARRRVGQGAVRVPYPLTGANIF
jgi:hypothetical protein